MATTHLIDVMLPHLRNTGSRVVEYPPRVGVVAATLARMLFAITNDAFRSENRARDLILEPEPAGSQSARVRAFPCNDAFRPCSEKVSTFLHVESIFLESTRSISRKFGFASPKEFDEHSALAFAKGLVEKSARNRVRRQSSIPANFRKPNIGESVKNQQWESGKIQLDSGYHSARMHMIVLIPHS